MEGRDVVTVHELTPSTLLAACAAFESEYGVTSQEFYTRYLEGEFVGIHDAYRWAGYWKNYLDMQGSSARSLPDKEPNEELLKAVG